MNISSIKDNIAVQFIDVFFEAVGRENAYKMMAEFKCERVPALQDFLTKDYNGRIKPYIVEKSAERVFTTLIRQAYC